MKALFLLPMALFELLLIGIGWVLAVIHPKTAKRFVAWSIRSMPDRGWYRQ